MNTTQLKTNRLLLRQINEDDLKLLYEWRNNSEFIELCSVRRFSVNFEDFLVELRTDFQRDRHEQYMVELRGSRQVIGTVFSYNFNTVDRYAFVTIFLTKSFQNRGYGPEIMAIFLKYLFCSFSLFKVYLEVYSYNRHSLACLRKAGLVEEGIFRGHRLINGNRFDLIRFAAYQDQYLPFINGLVDRFNRLFHSQQGEDNVRIW